MRLMFSLVLVLVCVVSLRAQDTLRWEQLRPGDIVFQDLDCGPFCEAIERVTEGHGGQDFSHCALVYPQGDSLVVLEATGRGVVLTPLAAFFAKKQNTLPKVGRLKTEYQALIPKALEQAASRKGAKYDEVFDLNNDTYYCSELVHFAFLEANDGEALFPTPPMTFKDPDTQAYFPIWVDYYKKLGKSIPEGEAGLNPGGISRSEKLEVFFVVP